MSTLDLEQELELNTKNSLNLEEEQNNFLQTNLGKVINTGLEIGIKALLPDFIEDDVIEIKDDLFDEGFSEALNTTVDKVINLGKNVVGLITGNIENISQAEEIIKEGGLIDGVSDLIDTALNQGEKHGIISKGISTIIKTGKDTLLNTIENNIDNNFDTQIETVEKLDKYIERWQKYYEKQDFNNMEYQYEKIMENLEDVLPLEEIVIKARQLENIHNLIKNNGKNFNLSEEELELANKLI
ncbi:MAG: hypothetical protein E7310_04395 [Clostridiales bacterium]|nr:hypothetical protein [Clostridiales bacterium]